MTKKIPITGTGTYRILSHKTEMVKFPTNKKKGRIRIEKLERKKEKKKMSESKVSKRKQTASMIENRI